VTNYNEMFLHVMCIKCLRQKLDCGKTDFLTTVNNQHWTATKWYPVYTRFYKYWPALLLCISSSI